MVTWNQKTPPDNIYAMRSFVDIPPDGFFMAQLTRTPYAGYEAATPRACLDGIVLEVSVFGWSVSMYAAPFPIGTYLSAVAGWDSPGYVAISITPEGGAEEIVIHSNSAKNGWSCSPINWSNGFSPVNYDRLEGPYSPIPAVGDAPYGHTFPSTVCLRFSKAGYFQPDTVYTVRVIVAPSYDPAGTMNPVEAGTYQPIEERSFTFTTADAAPAPPAVPPVVSNVSPAAGTELAPTDSVALDVTDDSGLFRRIILTAKFAGLETCEVVHDGDAFAPAYLEGSTRTAITGGYRFVLARRGGWPASPTITPYAIDRAGEENA